MICSGMGNGVITQEVTPPLTLTLTLTLILTLTHTRIKASQKQQTSEAITSKYTKQASAKKIVSELSEQVKQANAAQVQAHEAAQQQAVKLRLVETLAS